MFRLMFVVEVLTRHCELVKQSSAKCRPCGTFVTEVCTPWAVDPRLMKCCPCEAMVRFVPRDDRNHPVVSCMRHPSAWGTMAYALFATLRTPHPPLSLLLRCPQ